MKVWTYYAHPSEIFPKKEDIEYTEKEFGSDTDVLYALTPNKNYAKMFRQTRNMDIFHEIILDDLTDEEWNILSSENRDCYLEYRKIMTKHRVRDPKYPCDVVRVNMLLTFAEIVDIEDNTDIESIIVHEIIDSLSPLGILEHSLLKGLLKLHYWDILTLVTSNHDYDIDISMCQWTEMDDCLLSMTGEFERCRDRIKIDQLEYFIANYGHTLAV